MALIMPTVRHFLVCRKFFPVDASYSEVMMRVVFGLRPPPGRRYPIREKELHTFVQLVGGAGTFEFSAELFRMDLDPVSVAPASPPVEFEFTDRIAAYSFDRSFSNVPFERAGLYEFRLFARPVRGTAGEAPDDLHRQVLAGAPIRMEEAR